MKLKRLLKMVTVPWKYFYALFAPEAYARSCGVHLGKGTRIYGSSYTMFSTDPFLVRIGRNTHIVQKTVFITHDGGTLALRHLVPDLEITKPITVGDNCYLGMGVLVLPGVNIGNNVVIGAGSIVTRDIPDNSVAAGVPAKVIKTIDQYREKLEQESLHLGHLPGREKAVRLQEIYKDFIEDAKEYVKY